jgi:hypothetical protein
MRTAHRLSLLLLPLLAAVDAGGAEIHRCRQADGVVAFQAVPCAHDAHALGSTPIDPVPAHPSAARASREERQRIEAWSRHSRGRLAPSLGGREPRAPAASRSRAPATRGSEAGAGAAVACASARHARELAYRRDGNRMGFDRRRELQDAVSTACGLR